NGMDNRVYPWGESDDNPRANTAESGIQERSTAVGMYPGGIAKCGALDMAGNLYEWCFNSLSYLKNANGYYPKGFDDKKGRLLRGGSFLDSYTEAVNSSRNYNAPRYDDDTFGVRLVIAPILLL
ncbi:MAG: SUMF1/EgtB/PvdO family nonheme iron enzyme, partial [Chloroflexota bacterium]